MIAATVIPGNKNPGRMARFIDLNTATERELADLPMVGPKRARDLIQHRPFRGWDDVERVPGFSKGMVDDLKSGGAQLGSR